jgi:hypothetical protein
MRKEVFRNQLISASISATRFGQGYVLDTLLYNFRYIVILNQSYDGNCESDELTFPEDNGKVFCGLSGEQVVDLLFREGRCPLWIDISVVGASDDTTLLRLLSCGRYHADESRLYYYQQGTQPFGIKSPDLPPDWKEGCKFKLKKPCEAMKAMKALSQDTMRSSQ